MSETAIYQRTEKLTCPHCGKMDSKVIDSRPDQIHGQYRRRRQCEHCKSRYMTVEIVVAKITTTSRKAAS